MKGEKTTPFFPVLVLSAPVWPSGIQGRKRNIMQVEVEVVGRRGLGPLN